MKSKAVAIRDGFCFFSARPFVFLSTLKFTSMRIISVILLILATRYACPAQVNFSLKGGLNLSTLADEGDSEFSAFKTTKPGIHIGVSADWFSESNLGIAAELVYSNKGALYDGHTRHTDYLTLPVLLLCKTKSLRFEAGASPGLLIVTYGDPSLSGDSRDFYSKMNVDVVGGLSFGISPALRLGIRYEHGLTNIISKKATLAYRYIDANDPLITSVSLRDLGYSERHRNLQLSVIYNLSNPKR